MLWTGKTIPHFTSRRWCKDGFSHRAYFLRVCFSCDFFRAPLILLFSIFDLTYLDIASAAQRNIRFIIVGNGCASVQLKLFRLSIGCLFLVVVGCSAYDHDARARSSRTCCCVCVLIVSAPKPTVITQATCKVYLFFFCYALRLNRNDVLFSELWLLLR